MRKRLLPLLLAAVLLTGCAQAPAEEEKLHILAATYPVYLFTTALTQGIEGVEVELLVNAQTSCLHDYTLTVKNMKAIEGADVIILNGAGLEEFMADALAASDAAVIDCSEGMDLLPALEHHGHEGHDHAVEQDPHYWMDPRRAAGMVRAIADGLSALDPAHGDTYGQRYISLYDRMGGTVQDLDMAQLMLVNATGSALPLEALCSTTRFITFHDGFQYFAHAFGLELLKAIEEEEGSTASAAEIKEIVALIHEYDIPAIFVEKNGSRATAEVIARETGCEIYELDMLMSGEGTGIDPYLDAMTANLNTILEALL
ncbi:MAG: zinc ABC transporter substrate-binding protein [Oscillospiraceae bacterium]|jgi:zinc transport system substrate-binding protein|nr:zinc ABC transporter substrate-binding protein [Oscillospiraceae bacterium]